MKNPKILELRLLKLLAVVLACFGFFHSVQAKEIVVSAAASLSDAFKDIAKIYETSHPQDKILFNFGSSGSLLNQIAQGAPVDLFACADESTMDMAEQKGLILPGSRQDFINNHLVLVTFIHSKLQIRELADLDKPLIKWIALGQVVTVPAGRYTKHALQAAGLWQKLQDKFIPAQNVRQVLDYVARNEVDVGFVYESDAKLFSDKVKILYRVPLPKPVQYPVALVKNTQNPNQAKAFMDLLFSVKGQRIFRQYGFAVR